MVVDRPARENHDHLVCEEQFQEKLEGRCAIANHKAQAVGHKSAGKCAFHMPALSQRATLTGKRLVALQDSASYQTLAEPDAEAQLIHLYTTYICSGSLFPSCRKPGQSCTEQRDDIPVLPSDLC